MANRPREMDAFLGEPGHMVRVCTVSKSGMPHVIPLCYKFQPDDGTFFLSTGADSVTVKNLARGSAISLCIDDDEPPFRAVVVEGEADVSEVLGTDHEGLKIVIDQFFGQDAWDRYKETPTAKKIRVRVTVRPKKWKWWDFRRKLTGSEKI